MDEYILIYTYELYMYICTYVMDKYISVHI